MKKMFRWYWGLYWNCFDVLFWKIIHD